MAEDRVMLEEHRKTYASFLKVVGICGAFIIVILALLAAFVA